MMRISHFLVEAGAGDQGLLETDYRTLKELETGVLFLHGLLEVRYFEADVIQGGLKGKHLGFHEVQVMEHILVLGVKLLLGLSEGLSHFISIFVP
jgi:hypothetical protein